MFLKNHSDVLQLLIDNGARLDILNNEKKSAYDLTLDPKCKVLTEYKSKLVKLKRTEILIKFRKINYFLFIFLVDRNALLQENSEYLDNDDENSD